MAYIIIILVFWLVQLEAQVNRNKVERELFQTRIRIEKLERLLRYFDDNSIRVELEAIKIDFENARNLFVQNKFALCALQLKSINSKLYLLFKKIGDRPIFKRKFFRDLQRTLNKAEKLLDQSDSREARFYLKEAYNLKRQGERIATNNPGSFYQALEFFTLSKKMAEKAIRAAGAELWTNMDMERIKELKNELAKQWERIKKEESIDAETQIQITKMLQRAELAIQSQKPRIAIKTLQNIRRKLNEIDKIQLSVSRLMNQYYQQTKDLNKLEEKNIQDELILKVMERIKNNLSQIERALNEEKFLEARKLLQINFQLFRTISTVSGKNISRRELIESQYARFKKEIEKFQNTQKNMPAVVRLLSFLDTRIGMMLEQNNERRAIILLRKGFTILKTLKRNEEATILTRKELQKKLRQFELKIKKLQKKKQNNAEKLIHEIKNALKKNDIRTAQTLLQVLSIFIED